MQKDFDKWNTQKKSLESKDLKYLFKEGDIWWCSLGLNIKTESCGKGETFRRPILILKKLSQFSVIGIPLSTQFKQGSWFCEIKLLGQNQYAMLNQIRNLNISRFQRRLSTLDNLQFNKVKILLRILLNL
jgi:mRNA interferase MazF